MEQFLSTLNLLFSKQILWSWSIITSGLIFHPSYNVIRYSEDRQSRYYFLSMCLVYVLQVPLSPFISAL